MRQEYLDSRQLWLRECTTGPLVPPRWQSFPSPRNDNVVLNNPYSQSEVIRDAVMFSMARIDQDIGPPCCARNVSILLQD